MSKLSVAVLGLGGMGSAAAAAISSRGCQVIGFEQYWRAHDQGSSHGDTRAIRKAYVRDVAYVPLVLEAYELWRRMEKDSGTEILNECGGLVVTPPDSPTLARSIAVADAHRVPYEILEAKEVSRRWPTMNPSANSVTFFEPSQAIIRPEKTVSTNIETAIRHSAELHFNTIVHSWRVTENGVEVYTSAGKFQADKLVIAAGAWTRDMLPDLALPVEVGRLLQVWVEPQGGGAQFAIGHHPRWVLENSIGQVAYAFSTMPGQNSIKMAFSAGTPADIENFERKARPNEVEKLVEFMAELVPALRGRPASRVAACPYAHTPDENFAIGLHPEHSQVVIAAGFSSHGFKFVPVIGEILADLTEDGTTRRNIELFSPIRFRG